MPTSGTDEDDVAPAMVILLEQVEQALESMERAEQAREERFAEYEEIISEVEKAKQQVYNANTRFDFPSVGDVEVIYKAEKEKKLYQWNSAELRYEVLGDESMLEIEIINGGDAYGTD